jgi:S-adenosylmethionine hydrolase
MPSAISLVTLLTDFGDVDYFVPSMKGVMLGINAQLRTVDLTHHIPAGGVELAGYFVKSCDEYLADGSVHVGGVDPGVGSAGRALLSSS